MRKLNYFMIAAMFGISALVFTGCSKDDEEDISASELKLTGTWTFDEADYVLTVDGKDAKAWLVEDGYSEQEATEAINYVYEMLDDNFLEKGTTIEFKDDNSYILKRPISENTRKGPEGDEEGTWAFNADKTKIIFNDGEGDSEFDLDIASMTSKIMKLSVTQEEDYDLNDDDTDEILNFVRKLEFTK